MFYLSHLAISLYLVAKSVVKTPDVYKLWHFLLISLYKQLLKGVGADEAVYFCDAVHPEYQTRPSHGWVKKGTNPAVKTSSGRERVNIHGAFLSRPDCRIRLIALPPYCPDLNPIERLWKVMHRHV
jgi:hypothetical protein